MNIVVRMIVAGTCLAAVVACGRAPAQTPPTGHATQPTSVSVGVSSAGEGSGPAEPDEQGGSGAAPSGAPRSAPSAPGTAGPRDLPTRPTRQPPAKRPPRPKPPARWVLSPLDRISIEQRTGVSFDRATVEDFFRSVCPRGDVCVENKTEIDPSIGSQDEDCIVGRIDVPPTLYENGTVTWWINNPCGEGPTEPPAGS